MRRTRRRRGARRCRRRRRAAARAGAVSISIATPQSLKTQNPAACPRDAWMQAGDGNEGATRACLQTASTAVERRADDVARRLIDAAPGGVSPASKITEAARGALAHQVDVGRRVEPFELSREALGRACAGHARRGRNWCSFAHESLVPVPDRRDGRRRNRSARSRSPATRLHVAVGITSRRAFFVCAPLPVPRAARPPITYRPPLLTHAPFVPSHGSIHLQQ
jgi:hypothetical protein